MPTSRPVSSAAAAVLLALLAAAWFAALAARPLYRPDEARYAEVPREMVASGDWVTPRLNGFKYFEKPPLQYWATAVAFKVFGVSDWAARLWAGLAALGGVLLVVFAGRRLFDARAALFGAAVLASSPLYALYGQGNTLDMGLTLFLTAAVLAFALAQRNEAAERERRRWMLAFWAACAAAVLSKGLVGLVLPCGTVALYALVRRDSLLLRRLELVRGGLLFLLIAAPWFVAVSAANPEFAHFFFVQEHWQRYTSGIHHRVQPAWYFVPVLVLGMWPWLPAAAAGWIAAFRRPDTGFSPKLFLGLWALVVFAFFSASGSKLPPYILPVVPALALLAGDYLAAQRRRGLLIAQCVLVAAVAAVIWGAAGRLVQPGAEFFRELAPLYVPWLVAAGAIGLAGALAAAALAWRGRCEQALGGLALGVLAALLVGFTGHRVLSPVYSVSSLAASVPPAVPVFAVETYDHSMPWTLRRTVTMVNYKDELKQAIAWEPDRFIPDLAGFARAWSAEREAYAFFQARDFERLRRELDVPMEIVARGPRYLIVRKP